MKVLLIISDYEFGFPFIQDLESELIKAGVEVDVLDVNHHWHKQNGVKKNFAPASFKKLKSVRKVGTFFTLFFAKKYFRKLKGMYDAVNIHSCEHLYYYLVNDIKKISPNLSVMIWGSDFYRISNRMREQHRRIFDSVKHVVFGNPQNANDFTSYYKDYCDKSVIAGFGVKKFERIKELLKTSSVSEARNYFGLPSDKIMISCGYNGREMQQHLLLLDEVARLSAGLIQKIFLVFQVGYGTDPVYLEKIRNRLEQINVSYKILDKMFSDEEIAMLRVVPDITLNAQISDGFSSSIQEHLLAQNILIVGDWLPYSLLQDKGVFFKSCAAEKFHIEIQDAILHLSDYKESVKKNTAIIDSISGWSVRIEQWKRVYSDDVADLRYQKNNCGNNY